MWELRWVLLGLGAALIIGVYLWGKGVFRRFMPEGMIGRLWVPSRKVVQPDLDEELEPIPDWVAPESKARLPERVVTVRLIPKDKELNTASALIAMRSAGLQHGRYGIFHRTSDDADEPVFSVASLTEPGSFDLADVADSTIQGLSFFMVLPGPGDPVERFDSMVETARSLAHDLEAELHDERGSSWSIQRERYVREELIEYRHQYSHS